MAFWSNVKSAIKRSGTNPENPANSLTHFMQGAASHGAPAIVPTIENAIGLTSVYKSIRIISEDQGGLSRAVCIEDAAGHKVKNKSHPVYPIIHDRPSPYYNSFTFFETMTANAAARGQSFAVIHRGKNTGKVQELEMLDIQQVKAVKLKSGAFGYHDYSTGQTYFAEDIIHLKYSSFDGINGVSPLTVARETMGIGLNATNYAKKMYENGAMLSGFLEHPETLGQESITNLEDSIKRNYSGQKNAGKFMVLEEGMKFKASTLSPVDVEYVKISRLTQSDVAGIYRLPLHMLGDLERSTNNNIEHQGGDYVKYCQAPWARRWETELNDKLFTRKERAAGCCVQINLESLLRGDIKTRAAYYKDMVNIGAMSRNEVRAKENYPPIEGLDKILVPLNMISQDELKNAENEN